MHIRTYQAITSLVATISQPNAILNHSKPFLFPFHTLGLFHLGRLSCLGGLFGLGFRLCCTLTSVSAQRTPSLVATRRDAAASTFLGLSDNRESSNRKQAVGSRRLGVLHHDKGSQPAMPSADNVGRGLRGFRPRVQSSRLIHPLQYIVLLVEFEVLRQRASESVITERILSNRAKTSNVLLIHQIHQIDHIGESTEEECCFPVGFLGSGHLDDPVTDLKLVHEGGRGDRSDVCLTR